MIFGVWKHKDEFKESCIHSLFKAKHSYMTLIVINKTKVQTDFLGPQRHMVYINKVIYFNVLAYIKFNICFKNKCLNADKIISSYTMPSNFVLLLTSKANK